MTYETKNATHKKIFSVTTVVCNTGKCEPRLYNLFTKRLLGVSVNNRKSSFMLFRYKTTQINKQRMSLIESPVYLKAKCVLLIGLHAGQNSRSFLVALTEIILHSFAACYCITSDSILSRFRSCNFKFFT
jgi:hypothetical protein